MTAIAVRASGGPEMLVPETRPVPCLDDEEILVRVHARMESSAHIGKIVLTVAD
jgi:NADPH:quinone reductase-like Zn-dependent oxidoreductase